MILISMKEELEYSLVKISELVDLLEKDAHNFTESSIELASDIEKKAKEFRLPIESDIALVRGKLINVESNPIQVKEDGYTNTRKERRKIRNQKTLECLQELHKIIFDFTKHSSAVFEECNSLCMQLISRVIQYSKDVESKSKESLKDEIWNEAKLHPELSQILNHVIGLCGLINAKIIFERCIYYVIQ